VRPARCHFHHRVVREQLAVQRPSDGTFRLDEKERDGTAGLEPMLCVRGDCDDRAAETTVPRADFEVALEGERYLDRVMGMLLHLGGLACSLQHPEAGAFPDDDPATTHDRNKPSPPGVATS